MILIFELLCFVLSYSAFCRAVHLDHTVLRRLRVAVTSVACAGLYGMYLPFTGWVPDHVHIVLAAAACVYLAAFSKAWPPQGPLPSMKRPEHT